MKILTAIIEKSSNGEYGVYLPDIPGYTGLGNTENDAKNDLREAINEVVSYCKEQGINDNIYGGDVDFNYQYDFSDTSFKRKQKKIEKGIHQFA